MAKMKCYCKVVYASNPEVPQKTLADRSESYVIGGNLNNVVVNQYKEFA